jgi:hypothetical protein
VPPEALIVPPSEEETVKVYVLISASSGTGASLAQEKRMKAKRESNFLISFEIWLGLNLNIVSRNKKYMKILNELFYYGYFISSLVYVGIKLYPLY